MSASNMKVIKAALPFLAIPFVIWAYVAGREGISAILVGAILLSMFVPDFIHGNTLEVSGAYKSSSGKWLFSHVRTLSGPAARLSASRYLLVGLLLIAGGAIETVHSGRIRALYTEGSGWAWTLVLTGGLLALTAIIRVAPGLPADDSSPVRSLGRAIPLILSGGLFALALALVVLGWCEVSEPGSITHWIRDLNPLAGP